MLGNCCPGNGFGRFLCNTLRTGSAQSLRLRLSDHDCFGAKSRQNIKSSVRDSGWDRLCVRGSIRGRLVSNKSSDSMAPLYTRETDSAEIFPRQQISGLRRSAQKAQAAT